MPPFTESEENGEGDDSFVELDSEEVYRKIELFERVCLLCFFIPLSISFSLSNDCFLGPPNSDPRNGSYSQRRLRLQSTYERANARWG